MDGVELAGRPISCEVAKHRRKTRDEMSRQDPRRGGFRDRGYDRGGGYGYRRGRGRSPPRGMRGGPRDYDRGDDRMRPGEERPRRRSPPRAGAAPPRRRSR